MEIRAELGGVPFDEGIPLMTVTRGDDWSFRVQVPGDLTRISANLGAKVEVALEDDIGVVGGTVITHGQTGVDEETGGSIAEKAKPGHVWLIIHLDRFEGLEPQLKGQLRLKSAKQEVALVPKDAVDFRGSVPYTRVWEPEDRLIGERTLKIEGDEGSSWDRGRRRVPRRARGAPGDVAQLTPGETGGPPRTAVRHSRPA